jgi:hypothetical protein
MWDGLDYAAGLALFIGAGILISAGIALGLVLS